MTSTAAPPPAGRSRYDLLRQPKLTAMSAAGRANIRTFIAAIITFAVGLGAAPNLTDPRDIAVAALAAIGTGLLRVIAAYAPQISFAAYVPPPFGDWIDAFVQSAISTFVLLATGWFSAPNLNEWRSAWTAIIVGALAAGAHAVQDLLTPGRSPSPSFGLPEPRKP